jgi:carboxylate-amine ligase
MTARTIGVEEEFLLFAEDAPRLVDLGAAVARAADRNDSGSGSTDGSIDHDAKFQKELMQAQAEHASPPSSSLAVLAADLAAQRERLISSACERGARLVATGTSPVRNATSTTDDERYRQMADRFAVVAEDQLACAMHIHVSVNSDDEGVTVIDRLAPWLHVLLALTANSPFHDGRDTGYASYRRLLWGLWPTSGPNTEFGDVKTYRKTIDHLVATGAARDKGMIYFDARLSADYPTVEIRVCDVVREVDDAVTIAGLVRALVATLAADDSAGAARVELLHAAGWRAARYGMDDTLADLTGATGSDALVPAWELVDALLQYVDRELAAADDRERVRAGLDRLRSRGTGASRQHAAARSDGLPGVIDAMTLRRNEGACAG